MQHLMAPFPCVLQWLSDNMVSPKMADEGLIRSRSYSMKTLAASKLMTPISEGNNTVQKWRRPPTCIVPLPTCLLQHFSSFGLQWPSIWNPPRRLYIGWSFPGLINWLPPKLCLQIFALGRSCGCCLENLESFHIPPKSVSHVGIRAASAGDFFYYCVLLGSLESPPSIMVTRNLWSARVWVRDWLCKGKTHHP